MQPHNIGKEPHDKNARHYCIRNIHGTVEKAWFAFISKCTFGTGIAHQQGFVKRVRIIALEYFTLVAAWAFVGNG